MSDRSQLWLWIMDYLSSFPEIDVSILNGLIETAPMPTDILRETTEMFALRCLEDMLQFLPENDLGNVAPPDMRVEFDLSLSCSDVLHQIQKEISLSNPRTTEQGLLRWDIQPFIKHKRASLPECALEQMKGLILEEGNNVLDGDGNMRTSSFEDGGALPKGHGGDAGALPKGHGGDAGALPMDHGGDAGALPMGHGGDAGALPKGHGGDAGALPKGHGGDAAALPMGHGGDAGALPMGHGGDAGALPKGHGGDAGALPKGHGGDAGALPKGHGGDAGEDNAQDYPSRSVNSTSVDENENGRPNIVAIKSRFLSLLRGRPSRDPVGEASCTQQNLCIICNENGQVLVCSCSDCRLMVHESCLGPSAIFDDKCNFLCPFCASSLSFSNYLEGKDRISSVRKDLSALMKLLAKNLPEIQRVLPSH